MLRTFLYTHAQSLVETAIMSFSSPAISPACAISFAWSLWMNCVGLAWRSTFSSVTGSRAAWNPSIGTVRDRNSTWSPSVNMRWRSSLNSSLSVSGPRRASRSAGRVRGFSMGVSTIAALEMITSLL